MRKKLTPNETAAIREIMRISNGCHACTVPENRPAKARGWCPDWCAEFTKLELRDAVNIFND